MKKINFLCASLCLLLACGNPESKPDEASDATSASTESIPDVELTGNLNVDKGKAAIAGLAAGNVDTWLADFADDARFYWNAGDSLVGKKAIVDYWKERRMKVIDSISFSNDIWLSLKVNKPQSEADAPGQYLLSWYFVTAKYKTGKSMSQWIHAIAHYNDAGKIDWYSQYLDKAPINKAATP